MWKWKSYLRFSIRELALLAAIVGLILAWRLDHYQLTRQFRYTGQPLDLAIEGKGFFSLQDETTAVRVYTRSGQFSINDRGLLVARLDGKEWPIEPFICMPDNSAAITISPEGKVSVLPPGALALVAVGQLQLADFDDPGKLRRLTASVCAQTDASGPALLCPPTREGFGCVLQGVLDPSATQKLSLNPWRW
jgi:flagellar basal-body rod protein FlgG